MTISTQHSSALTIVKHTDSSALPNLTTLGADRIMTEPELGLSCLIEDLGLDYVGYKSATGQRYGEIPVVDDGYMSHSQMIRQTHAKLIVAYFPESRYIIAELSLANGDYVFYSKQTDRWYQYQLLTEKIKLYTTKGLQIND